MSDQDSLQLSLSELSQQALILELNGQDVSMRYETRKIAALVGLSGLQKPFPIVFASQLKA